MDEIFEEIEYAQSVGLTSIEVASYRLGGIHLATLKELGFTIEKYFYGQGYDFYEISWSKDD